MPRKNRKARHTYLQWKHYLWPITLSIAVFIVSTYGGNMLNDISPLAGFILFISCLCIILGYWTWVLSNKARKWRPFGTTLCREISVALVVFAVVFTSPYYVDHFIKSQGGIEMPTFVDDSTQILVYYGNRPNPVIHTRTTIGELKRNPQTAFRISVGNNNQTIFYVHIEGNRLYVDTSLFAGIIDAKRHIFFPPVVIKNNAFSRSPSGWKIYQNSRALEIINENGVPVLVLEYKSPYEIVIAGLFVTPMGICKVDNTIEHAIFQLGDTLSELGTYKVTRVFVHSFLDLFKSERTYILHD